MDRQRQRDRGEPRGEHQECNRFSGRVEIVIETGKTRVVVPKPAVAPLGSSSGIFRMAFLQEEARIAGFVGEQILDRVEMPVGRGRDGRKERKEVTSSEASQTDHSHTTGRGHHWRVTHAGARIRPPSGAVKTPRKVREKAAAFSVVRAAERRRERCSLAPNDSTPPLNQLARFPFGAVCWCGGELPVAQRYRPAVPGLCE